MGGRNFSKRRLVWGIIGYENWCLSNSLRISSVNSAGSGKAAVPTSAKLTTNLVVWSIRAWSLLTDWMGSLCHPRDRENISRASFHSIVFPPPTFVSLTFFLSLVDLSFRPSFIYLVVSFLPFFFSQNTCVLYSLLPFVHFLPFCFSLSPLPSSFMFYFLFSFSFNFSFVCFSLTGRQMMVLWTVNIWGLLRFSVPFAGLYFIRVAEFIATNCYRREVFRIQT